MTPVNYAQVMGVIGQRPGFVYKPDKAPFLDLIPSCFQGTSAVLYELSGVPDLIVRTTAKFGGCPEKKKLTTKEEIVHWTKRIHEFLVFIRICGIRMADTNYLFGNDLTFRPRLTRAQEENMKISEESPALLMTTVRVDGKNLDEMTSFDLNAIGEIDDLFSGFFFGFFDSYKKTTTWWKDFCNAQFVYGTLSGSLEPHVYLIDAEPKMSEWRSFDAYEKEYHFWREIVLGLDQLSRLERKFVGTDLVCTKTREMWKQIISEMPIPSAEVTQGYRERINLHLWKNQRRLPRGGVFFCGASAIRILLSGSAGYYITGELEHVKMIS